MRQFLPALVAVSCLAVAGPAYRSANAQETQPPQVLVDAAADVVVEMSVDPHYPEIAQYLDRAKAVIVVPQLIKAGLIVGGEGGEAVALAKRADGGWTAPAFYTLAGGSIGLQAGAESKRMIIAVMTDKALNKLMSNQLEVGVDASISMGTVGGGVGASSVGSMEADMVTFSRSKGLFGGVSVDGTLIRPQPEKNAAYYGAGADVKAILIDGTASNAGAASLQSALAAR